MEARVRGRSWQGSAADRAGRTVGDREGTLDPRSERRRSPVHIPTRHGSSLARHTDAHPGALSRRTSTLLDLDLAIAQESALSSSSDGPQVLTSRPLLSTPALAANASLGEYSRQASSSFVMPSSPPPYCRVVWAPVQVSVVSGSLGADIDRLD
ncbi:hypothetical protein FNF29_04021 [Cafeteria roenbergensis]|uniref:Uncharacterized protein n=1 Tax=Cafeteria roenbergensis TaxID=33653 RepID=A0A5A8CI43_CAFRO|nr:hypothetical protein FNF29_04021 [Cafeteria roenbergensis]|eukprot:KAA0152154.1 hypothetical protein FNF29_04021 [Cafeteria roenbergensis]